MLVDRIPGRQAAVLIVQSEGSVGRVIDASKRSKRQRSNAPAIERGARMAVAAVLLVAGLASSSHAASTAAQKCEASKNGSAGKYNACIYKAQQSFVAHGAVDTIGRSEDLERCEQNFSK